MPTKWLNQLSERWALLLPAESTVCIGLSGGMDSVVLLHLLHGLAPRFRWHLSALHVHHGISQHADAWAEFCARTCADLAIPMSIERVDIQPLRQHGIEAAARKLRYAALMRQACDFIALAHHADDQVETLLLQLLRGAGVRGGAAMPQLSAGRPALVRPLLHLPRADLLTYANQRGLRWIEDESNADDRYPRNFLRQRVLPLLAQRFPAYRQTLARSAGHLAEAGHLLDELAMQDADMLDGAGDGATLDVSRLRSLPPHRAKNLLRYFLHGRGAPMPHSALLGDMLRQLCEAREDAAVAINYAGWQIRRYRGEVHAFQALAEIDPTLKLAWQGDAELAWPALGVRLKFAAGVGIGISLAALQRAPVSLRLRCGGEVLRPHPAAATRTLKHLLQERAVPPWRRERLPLLYCGDELVCVIGVATAAAYQASDGEPAITVELVG